MAVTVAAGLPTFSRPRKTIAFGTAITSLIPPRNKSRTKVTALKYTAAGTAHTLTILRALARTKVVTAAVAGATSLVLARDPGNYSANFALDAAKGPNTDGTQQGGFPAGGTGGIQPLAANNLIASGDFLAVAIGGGDQAFYVASVSAAATASNGQVTVTVTAVPTGGVAAGAAVYFFGTTTDVHPLTGEAHPQFSGTASTTVTLGAAGDEVVSSVGIDEPLLFHSDNITATGVLEAIAGAYAIN